MAQKRKIGPHELQILNILLKENAITKNVYEGCIYKFEAYGGFIDEIAMELGGLDEKRFLGIIASYYQTKFVTMEKIKNANFSNEILRVIPQKIAKQHFVFPIGFDESTKTLTVITSRPNDIEAISDIERISGARKVKTYVAKSSTINAAIKKWYEKDTNAFIKVEEEDSRAYQQTAVIYEKHLIEDKEEEIQGFESQQEKDSNIEMFSESYKHQEKKPDFISITMQDFLSSMQIMTGLIEKERGDLKGHSVHVSRCIKQICERIRLSENEASTYTLAGLLHDLGKTGIYHLTSLNTSLYDGHRESAAKKFMLPVKIFEGVKIPSETKSAIEYMYERYDGGGIPGEKQGKDIPIGARILSVVDTFSDLILNPRNPYRKTLSEDEAISCLEQHRGTIFDPMIVDAIKANVAGAKLKSSILYAQRSILIVEPDNEIGTILDLNLANRGFNVEICTNSKAALEKIQSKKYGLILTEVNLEPFDGFELIKKIKKEIGQEDLPVIFYTSRSGTVDVERGFSLGAVDYVVKPTSIELVVAKISKIFMESAEKAPPSLGGVSGSLSEMDLPDLIQVLSQGRKTCKLKITSQNQSGEIHFLNGQIVNALFDRSEGEDAFYKLLKVNEGFFTVDPKFTPVKTTINMGTEALLLEGMRLLDESQKN